MKRIITGLFAIAAFTFSASAQTNDNTNGHGNWNKDRQGNHQGHEGMGMRGMETLNLTETQKQQIKSINENFRTRMQALNQNDNATVKDARTQRQLLLDERRDKIAAILTPDQKAQFAQLSKQGDFGGRGEGRMGQMGGDRMNGGDRGRMGQGGAGRLEQMKTDLGLTDDQVARIKAGSESFRQRAEDIRNNKSLSEDQKKQQMETLHKEREASLKSVLTAEQIAKFEQMKGGNKDWKEKRKDKNGKEKIKVKTT